MRMLNQVLTVSAILIGLAAPVLAAPTVKKAKILKTPGGGLMVCVRGTFDVDAWAEASEVTVGVGSAEQSVAASAFRVRGKQALYLGCSGLVRFAKLDLRRGRFRVFCISQYGEDYADPLDFSFGLTSLWNFEIPVNEDRRCSMFRGVLTGSSGFAVTGFDLVDTDGNILGGDGSDGAPRDSRILLTFSSAVDMATVGQPMIRIGIPLGNLFLEAIGRFESVPGRSDQVLFNPQATWPTGSVLDNPLGFDANMMYAVDVLSTADQADTVQSTAGDPIEESFHAMFTTGTTYATDWGAPSVVGTDPAHGDVDVDAEADVDIEFSVPIHPDTLAVGDTIIVENLDVLDAGNNPIEVPGTLRSSADWKTVTFRPLFGYGQGPHEIRVTVTTRVESLSGDPLPEDVVFTFTTEFDPLQPPAGSLP